MDDLLTPAEAAAAAATPPAPVRAPVLVAGEELDVAEWLPVVNPARTSEVVGEVAMGGAEHVDRAVQAAAAAFPAWAALHPRERAERMAAAAAALAEHVGRLGELLTREQGKVLWETKLDVGGAGYMLKWYTDLADSLAEDEVFRSDARGTIWTGRRPMGVTGVIVPWNSPVYLGFLGIAPALLAGNTVVVKPSELAPLALGEVLRIVAEHFPTGVLNVVPGGREAGAAIAGHPLIRKVFFTGSTTTGQAVMREAAGNLKNISLELGGNDPAIVLESAHVDDALAEELVRSVYSASGQICFDVKRIYVHEAHHADFVERFTAAADRLVVGDGLDPRVSMGPVSNRAQYDKVSGLIERTKASGATVRTVGRQLDPGSWDEGLFLLPSVVTDVDPKAEVVVDEQFGPVVPILPFTDDAEAIAMANDTEFGLAASVWSRDREHALRVARQVQSGTVFINVHRYGASDVSMPFGGVKGSGIGRGHGLSALHACTELQTVADYVDVSAFPGPDNR
jgi:aldehyde dehydrogenase